MELLILLLTIPVIWVIVARLIFKKALSWQENLCHIGAAVLFTAILWFAGTAMRTSDQKLIHGQVVEKVRDQDTHMESYSCNCRSYKCGKSTCRTCQTCWRRVWTIEWYLKTSIGNIGIDSDRGYTPLVWAARDPKIYADAYEGEPCSKWVSFENYVKGAPQSLFNNAEVVAGSALVPAYPQMHSIYRVENVINIGTAAKVKQWNEQLREHLKTLSKKKGVNIVIVFTNNKDPKHALAIEQGWLGGKENDVVVVIGAPEYPKVAWVDAFAFGKSAGNQMLVTKIRDDIRNAGTLDPANTSEVIVGHVKQSFAPKLMRDFEYLKSEIAPTDTMLFVIGLMQLLINIGLTWLFVKTDYFNSQTTKRKWSGMYAR